MTQVTKRDSSTEPFNRQKIERSIRKAGADETTAKEIAGEIPDKTMSTCQIRVSVTDKLRERSDDLADHYASTFRLMLKRGEESLRGVALMAEETMERLKIKLGDVLHLTYIGKQHLVRIEVDQDVGRSEIQLHPDDIAALGAEEGKKVATCRQNSYHGPPSH